MTSQAHTVPKRQSQNGRPDLPGFKPTSVLLCHLLDSGLLVSLVPGGRQLDRVQTGKGGHRPRSHNVKVLGSLARVGCVSSITVCPTLSFKALNLGPVWLLGVLAALMSMWKLVLPMLHFCQSSPGIPFHFYLSLSVQMG